MESEPLLRRKLPEADSAWPLGVATWNPQDSRMAVVKLLAICVEPKHGMSYCW